GDQLTPVAAAGSLAIDLPGSLQFGLRGTVSGTGSGGGLNDVLISADPVFIGGTAAFALTRQTVDVDTDGNGTPDLLGATLDAMALSVSNASVAVSGLVTMTVSGDLTLARVTAA